MAGELWLYIQAPSSDAGELWLYIQAPSSDGGGVECLEVVAANQKSYTESGALYYRLTL